ncbi:MAG: hypothetical protein V1872_03235, partial [bacterium]
IKKDPSHYYARYNLASILQDERAYDQSLIEFVRTTQEVIKSEKLSILSKDKLIGCICFHEGEIYHRLNKYDEAKEKLFQCVRIYSGHNKAKKYLSMIDKDKYGK